jgi:predicted phosphodiesterase
MRLQLISDLHSEFWSPAQLFERITIVSDLDFLVIAGDTVVPGRQPEANMKAVFRHFSSLAKNVILAEGNHEYYGSLSTEETEKRIQDMLPANYHWLRNNELTIDGIHFFGGAMWFNNDDGLNQFYEREMNDFNLIKHFTKWVYDRNKEFTAKATELVRPETIVVTHYLPHSSCTPEKFKNEPTNRFFVCDQTALIEQKRPRLWLFGHTHMPCDHTLGETRLVCNPFGYPNETYKINGNPYPVAVFDI